MNILEILKTNAEDAKKYIASVLAEKQSTLTFDATPTENSNNPVTSGGLYTTISNLATKADVSSIPKFAISVVDSLPTSGVSDTTVYLLKTGTESQNLYTEYIHVNNVWEELGTQSVDLSGYLKIADAASSYQKKLTFDSAPTANSMNPVTSDGIKKAIDAKTVDLSGYQTKLTFDSTPTANSSNPVTSDGIKKAIDAKTVDLSNYYTKTQVDTAITQAISAIIDGDNKSY